MLASSALPIVLVAILHLSLSSVAIACYPDFQLLNVKQTFIGTKIPSETQGKWKLKLVHKDKLSSNTSGTFRDHSRRFHERMQRDVKRVSNLLQRLSSGGGHDGGAVYEVNDFGSDVVSGIDQGSGEYFVRIGVGSPPKSQYVVIDSGSDIVWVQCQCYKESDPVFYSADSASYAGISCCFAVCDRIENSGCNAGQYRYEVLYDDGSYTTGTLALETLTSSRTVVKNVAIGCGHINWGMCIGVAGLLSLGGGSLSLGGQLGGQIVGAFSYCLVNQGSDVSGSLEFGRGAMLVGVAWVNLLCNLQAPSFYYVGFSGLKVGGIRMLLTELGYEGVVMDIRTANALRDAFIAQTANLSRISTVSIFNTCYNLSNFVMIRVPTMSFYFLGGPILTLPASNFLIPVDDVGTFYLAFASSTFGLSIIGNIQQEGIQISFDGAYGSVGFGPNVC
ncbi:hypothetical protein GOBAR_AA05765 [Gossypium barbadense]|uniref:Peptidase A1 domain-containing protein n=1 Tax=Gossypium barbadense TaxID=3634 RepID=A0A2P5YGU1_GOSBA|nr:hypothetical protein GOBAR_AA05765 [Gossypium barbadense]